MSNFYIHYRPRWTHTDWTIISKYLTHFDINTIYILFFFFRWKNWNKNDGRIIVPEIFKTNLLENLEKIILNLGIWFCCC